MPGNHISWNDPCPCGSGKKFKNCCIDRRPVPILPAPPRSTAAPSDLGFLGPFRAVDAKLKEVATESPQQGEWKERVGRLSESTSSQERLEAYRFVRQAGVLPDDVAGFLFGHAAQWMPSEGWADDLNSQTLALLREAGQDDLADLFIANRMEYDRRYERGRQFFFGPPDEELAKVLRGKGVID
jgi:hypothetical protein